MIKIAVDALGGDNAPQVVIEGVIQAIKSSQGRFGVVLTGPQDTIEKELQRVGADRDCIEVFHAPEVVEMDESPAEVLKTKRNSSLVSCVGLQKKGVVGASFSAGNSGAMMAACLMILGRVAGIPRPAIACDLPSLGSNVTLLDCGANVDEKPIQLLHFGICGSIYAQSIRGIKNPKVGLLNIGEEEKKGPELIQETYQLLKNSALNFIGNVEGRDIVKGVADVVVAPGYTGNVILKLMEGFYELHTQLFGIINTDAGRQFNSKWDYSNQGGALLLGLNGTGIITHGRSEAKSICNAVRMAYMLASNRVSDKIADKLEESNQCQ